MSQCQAKTTSGERCSRGAISGEDYCWQHGHTKHATREMYDPKFIAETLLKCNGSPSDAAKAIGCERRTIYKYCDRHEICERAKEQARNSLVDKARSTLGEAMDEAEDYRDKINAAKIAIKEYDRQTVPEKVKSEHDHKSSDGSMATPSVDWTEVSDEEAEKLIEVLEKASSD